VAPRGESSVGPFRPRAVASARIKISDAFRALANLAIRKLREVFDSELALVDPDLGEVRRRCDAFLKFYPDQLQAFGRRKCLLKFSWQGRRYGTNP
jgi:hypothetical protein